MRASGIALLIVAAAVLVPACGTDDDSAADVALRADFDYEVDYETTGPTNCPVRSISFTDTSTGEPTDHLWEFPDGSTSTNPSPTLEPVPGGVSFGADEVTLTVRRGDERDVVRRRVELVQC